MPHLRTFLLATCLLVPLARAEVPGNTVGAGVLTDMSGSFSDEVGQGSVEAAKLAAAEFAADSGGLTVEIISADH